MRQTFVVILLSLIYLTSYGQNTQVPFNQEDRETIKKLETKVENIDKRLIIVETKIDEGFKSIENHLSFNNNLIITILISMFTIFLGLIAFIFWDRKTLLRPSKKRFEKLEQQINELKTKVAQLGSS